MCSDGANGAGKSTLMKVLAFQIQDIQEVLYNGNPVELRNPAAAKNLESRLYIRKLIWL